jgi:DNA-binding MurR/RpiR family transcriptional regulator
MLFDVAGRWTLAVLATREAFMSLTTLIEKNQVRLTDADRRLLKALLESPTEVSYLSTTDIAGRAGVHPATAVRLARKLGFGGYPDLRSYLQADIINKAEPADRIRESLSHMEEGAILSGLLRHETDTLDRLDSRDLQIKINQAARALIDAGHIFIFGQGNSTALVEMMGRRLRRAGFHHTILNHQDRELAERILPMKSDDALLAFGFHSVPRGIATCLNHSRRVGATSILVSDLVAPLIKPEPEITLMADRGLGSEFLTLTVPMAICNAIVLTISHLDKGRSIATLERLAELTREIQEEPRARQTLSLTGSDLSDGE